MFITLPVLFLIAQVDKERVAQITERAVRDAEWILNKYRRQKWYAVRHHGTAKIRGELGRNCWCLLEAKRHLNRAVEI